MLSALPRIQYTVRHPEYFGLAFAATRDKLGGSPGTPLPLELPNVLESRPSF